MAISADNVTVTISVADKSIEQAGFGVLAIIGPTQRFAGRMKEYAASSALKAMAADGFIPADPEYIAAQSILRSDPRPTTLKIGRRAPANVPDSDLKITPQTPVEGEVFSITVDGTTFSATADATPTVAEIATALDLAVIVAGMTTVDNTGSLSLQSTTAGSVFAISCSKNLDVEDLTVNASVETELADIFADDSDWYGFALASHSTLEAERAAIWAEANKRQFFASSSDTDILADDAGNLAEKFNDAGDNYTTLYVTRFPGNFPQLTWSGSRYPFTPGSESWKYVTLPGVTIDDYTASQIANIRSNKANYYVRDGGVNIMSEGWASSGRYIDLVRGLDWLNSQIKEAVYKVKVDAAANPGKVPGTDSGINMIVTAIQAVLARAVKVGFLTISPAPVVTFPNAVDISAANKAGRTLPDIDFSAVAAGAWHKTEITGKLSL